LQSSGFLPWNPSAKLWQAANKQVKQAIQTEMKNVHKKGQTRKAPLLSGNKIIAKYFKYTTKIGCGKFKTKDGYNREHTILSVSQDFMQP